MLKLFLWLRYLRKKRIVFLSITAVALSVSLLIVVASLFTSFIEAFEQSAVEIVGDVVLAAPAKFEKYDDFIELLEQLDSVQAATAILSTQGLLHLGSGDVRAVNIWGVEPETRTKVTAFKESLYRQAGSPGEPSFEVPGSPGASGVFVGIGILSEPDEKTDEYDFKMIDQMIGRRVVLTTGAVTAEEPGGADIKLSLLKRRSAALFISDIIVTGVYDIDKRCVYLPKDRLQRIVYPNLTTPLADQIQIKLRPGTDADVAVAEIEGMWRVFAADELGWGSYHILNTNVETARQMQSRYIAELRKQMGILMLIFGVVSCGVVVLVFCIFYMIARLRQKDIAIIKSCGAASSSVASVFLGFGACVGAIGAGIGTIAGYAVTKNINTIEEWIRIIFGLKLWKSSVYMFSRIPNDVNWDLALPIVLLAVAAAILGALIPAIVAARTKPVEILQYE